MTLYHGGFGKLGVGDLLLPPSRTGVSCASDFGAGHVHSRDLVYLTTDLESASSIAQLHPSRKGAVYEVEPIGELHADPDAKVEDMSFAVSSAKVVRVIRRYKISRFKMRKILRMCHEVGI